MMLHLKSLRNKLPIYAKADCLKKDQVMIMEKKDEEVRHEQMNKRSIK